MELRWEQGAGPEGQPAFALLYTIVTGQDYAIERSEPCPALPEEAPLRIWAKATRVLYLTLVLVDENGAEHSCARTLLPGKWRQLDFDALEPPVDDGTRSGTLRLVDRTGSLGGQGPVSLKLVSPRFEPG
jgi:hypothetical protein